MVLGEEAVECSFHKVHSYYSNKISSLTSWRFCNNAASFTRRLCNLSSVIFLFFSHCTRDMSLIIPLLLASSITDWIFLFSFFSYWKEWEIFKIKNHKIERNNFLSQKSLLTQAFFHDNCFISFWTLEALTIPAWLLKFDLTLSKALSDSSLGLSGFWIRALSFSRFFIPTVNHTPSFFNPSIFL